MKFYDTCSLLKLNDRLFEEPFMISSITLGELEHIKTASNKDAETKYAARKLTKDLDENTDKYEVVIFKLSMLEPMIAADIEITNDIKILACALANADRISGFVTNDTCLKNIVGLFFDKELISSVGEEDEDQYCGYHDVQMTEDEMSYFYSHQTENIYNLKVNEYLIVRDSSNKIVDQLVWIGGGYRALSYSSFRSKWFGEVKPIKNDVYQAFVADSLLNNRITMVKGPAGSGKTYLSLAFLLDKLEHGKIDKIIVFCNTVATKDSAKLGYLPGTRDEKLLDSQIGNLLISKLGDRIAVERMIDDGDLVLLPMSDIRGYDTTGMNAGIYISEAQNLSVNLMKLALQRLGDDSICIIDGDEKTQVDDVNFAGANNGMRRASKIFRGEDVYGEVRLKEVHRSRIAKIAEQM